MWIFVGCKCSVEVQNTTSFASATLMWFSGILLKMGMMLVFIFYLQNICFFCRRIIGCWRQWIEWRSQSTLTWSRLLAMWLAPWLIWMRSVSDTDLLTLVMKSQIPVSTNWLWFWVTSLQFPLPLYVSLLSILMLSSSLHFCLQIGFLLWKVLTKILYIFWVIPLCM